MTSLKRLMMTLYVWVKERCSIEICLLLVGYLVAFATIVDLAGLPEVDLNYDIITLQKKRVFKRETADWVLCFGPLNYGGTVWIQKIGNAIRYLLKPTGTCVIHVHPENSEVEWTDDVINYWGKRFGFKPTKMEIGHTDTSTMTEEELEIQHEVAQRSPDIALELSQGKTLVRPMIVWRWQSND